MKSSSVLALLALGAASLARADSTLPSGPLTLSQTVSAVLARYPSIDAAQAEIDAARAQTSQSDSERGPQVTGGANYNYLSYRPGIAFGGSVFYTAAEDTYNANVTISQLLTDFGRTDAIVAAARAGELSAKDALEDTRHTLGYQAIQAFYGVLLLRQSVAVTEEEITSLNEALRISQKKFDAGSATKFDVLTTQVRLANAQNRRTDTISSLEKQESRLRQLIGLEAGTPLALTGDFDSVPASPDLSTAISEGIKNRPEMRLAQDNEEVAKARLLAANRTSRPTLRASASGVLEDGNLPNLYDNHGFVTANVNLSVPIFTSGRIDADKLAARSAARSSSAREKALTQQIVDDVESALSDLKAAQARLGNADTLVAQAAEALNLAKTRYSNGVITNFELLDAQSAARSSELARLQARYDCMLASYAVARAAGRSPSV